MSSSPRDNSDLEGKLVPRRQALAALGTQPARVLDCFAGEGHMFEAVWRDGATEYLGLERRFARPAGDPRGECWRGDNRRLLDRAFARTDWNVVDLDAYGSPWQTFRAVARRTRAQRLVVTLTCGIQRNLLSARPTAWVSEVMGTTGLSYSGLLVRWYDDLVRWTIRHCLSGTGLRLARARRSLSRRNKDTWYWLIELRR